MSPLLALAMAPLMLGSCTVGERRSQCEAVCDWAVTCHADARDVDQAALTDRCLEATRASSDSCGRAEEGRLNVAAEGLLEPCVEAVDLRAADLECDAFTGSIDQIKTTTPPAACGATGVAAVDIFEAAKDATAETSAELCDRLAQTMCGRTEACILGDFAGAIPNEVSEQAGGTPMELCLQQLDATFTEDCIANDLYAAETSIEEVNTARQAARECLPTLADTACEDLFSTDPQGFVDGLSPLCVGVTATPDDLLSMAEVMVDLAETFAQYAE